MGQGINWIVDLSGINDAIGLSLALEDIGRQSRYAQDLITCAYRHVDEDFNREAAAFAATTGSLGHMFEWGTLGINTGRSNMRPDPMSEKARLWKNEFKPGRKISSLQFKFKPSVAIVPKPTSRKTGIPSDILKRLKTHIFWNKAYVLESGIPVTVKPKPDNKRQLLFVPNLWKGEKGFSMYNRPTQPNVSAETQGTFNIYWLDFWEGRGEEMIQNLVEEYAMEDLKRVVRKLNAKKQRSMHPINNQVDKLQQKRSARFIRKEMELAAKMRVGKNGY